MNAGVLAYRLGCIAPVSLAELDATAALLTRWDRKYLVPVPVADRFVEQLDHSVLVLDIDGTRQSHYESVYFDTPQRSSYLGAARGRTRRYKVRTRSYLDSGICFLEVKTRDPRGHTVKERHAHPVALRGRLDADGRAFVRPYPLIGEQCNALEPTLTTRYTRATLLVGRDRARVTIDTDVWAATPDGRTVALVDMAIIETKCGGPPGGADRLLWALGQRPIRVSKYCTSLAALCPELPSNAWTRALRHPWRVSEPGASSPAASTAWFLALAG